MKKTFILILLFFASCSAFGQDPQLFENTWYLQELTINGVTYTAPNNAEVSEVPANFIAPNGGEEFNTAICNTASASEILYKIGTLSFPEGMGITLIVCNLSENSNFEMLYFQDFFIENGPNPFGYEITTSKNNKTLFLTAQDGDTAIYGDQVLSVLENDTKIISITPNPFNTTIEIHANTSLSSITVRNVLGQVVFSKKLDNSDSAVLVDFAHLKSGVYFALVKDSKGNRAVKKLIKQ